VPLTCKACGTPLIWAKTEKGASIPIDLQPARPEYGNIVLQYGLAGPPRADMVKPGHGTHVAHYATCPEAGRFRRPK